MGIPLSRQLSAIVYAIFTGALIGVLYDAVRILRVLLGVSSYTQRGKNFRARSLPWIGSAHTLRNAKERRVLRLVLLLLGDVFFALAAGCVFSVYLYHAASGAFRWFYLFGAFIGFALYYLTVGKLMMLFSEVLTFALVTAVRYTVFVLCAPFRLLARLICRFLKWICRRVWMPLRTAVLYKRRIRYTRRVRDALAQTIRFENQTEF